VTNLLGSEFPWSSHSNLLVNCAAGELNRILGDLLECCGPDVRACSLPGPLDLPSGHAGTLLLTRIEEMSAEQQVALFDWMTKVHSTTRVVSVATTRLDRLVRQGRFLEDLFYRLNVVQMDIERDVPLRERAFDAASC
jgi:transcriptional regulator of acetoin/glycerol metabolism